MKEKIAIVTGASRGLGKDTAIHLASLGYFVVLIARDKKALEEVNQQIHKSGGKSSFTSIDVSNCDQVKTCINEIVTQHRRIDLLFNNAAILKRGTTEISDNDIDDLLKINLNGAIYIAKYVAIQMKQQREGYIINVSSTGGKNAVSFAGVYAASKFGLCGFSEALTKEMSSYGVKVTNICPSTIATEMAEGRKFSLNQMIQTDDIIKTVDYLLSLGKNAIPTEIVINCMPIIEKTTESFLQMYLS